MTHRRAPRLKDMDASIRARDITAVASDAVERSQRVGDWVWPPSLLIRPIPAELDAIHTLRSAAMALEPRMPAQSQF